jgi:hypothetical protein
MASVQNLNSRRESWFVIGVTATVGTIRNAWLYRHRSGRFATFGYWPLRVWYQQYPYPVLFTPARGYHHADRQ